MDPSLATIFVAQARAEEVDLERLEILLHEIWTAARSTWPTLDVPAARFVSYLAERTFARVAEARALDVVGTLAMLHATDLYLACACVLNDPAAIVIFEAHYMVEVERALMRLGMATWVVDEAKQVLRLRFFLARTQDERSSLAGYAGRGSLQGWVSAAAVHAAFRVIRPPQRQADVDSSVMKAVTAPGDDLEIEYLKRRYADEFAEALRTVFASLSARERNIMRCYHNEGIGIDGVATLYRVHRVTASRWVKRITTTLLAATRRVLTDHLEADRAEVSSVLHLIQSRLDAIFRSVVATTSSDLVG